MKYKSVTKTLTLQLLSFDHRPAISSTTSSNRL